MNGEGLPSFPINVYHDESGNYGNGNWVCTGLLWVPEKDVDKMCKELQNARLEHEYEGEIHYKKLPRSFHEKYNGDARVALAWYKLWEQKWSKRTSFYVLAVNRTHQKYESHRYTKEYHAYNFFTATAIKSSLAWFFQDKERVSMKMYSDEKTRRPLVNKRITSFPDNFEDYILRKITSESGTGKCPKTEFRDKINCISCSKKGPYSSDEELLQLCDLLLGAVQNTIEPKAKKSTKKYFSSEINKLIKIKQIQGSDTNINVSFFPNDYGRFYNNALILENYPYVLNTS